MTTLYKKVGKRYKHVAEHEEWDSYPKGSHLVVCQPGSTLRRFNVDPDRAGLRAKVEQMERQKPVGTAHAMPGAGAFTMACFHVQDIPVGAKLYALPVAQTQGEEK